MRAIDADKLAGKATYMYGFGENKYVPEKAIKAAPTIIYADLVPHGRWVETKNGFHCTNCKRKPGQHPTKRGVFLSDFCPNCGAKMDVK